MSGPARESLLDPEDLARGQQTRREVLGLSHVESSYAVDELSPPKPELSKYFWRKFWSRPVLSGKSRSIANLAMLTALNRPHELKLHVRGALRNGVTRDEIREVFLQVAIYAGVPAGVDSFRAAREVFAQADSKTDTKTDSTDAAKG